MAVITISRGSLAGGKELATRLADELGCACLSREDLTAKAAELGVPVDKLQSSMAKPPSAYHGLRWDRDQYLACMTMLLCERILKEDLVYYGHAAHMLLCGVPNILRIRVLAESGFRIASVVRTMGLSREQAKHHIAQVDAGREKWVRFLYGVDWNDPTNYDMVVHLDQMGLNNAVAATLAVARQSDFEMTPAAKKAVKNLYVAGKAHLVLSTDPKTSVAHVRVSANDGRVQVICPPQYSETVPHIKDVISSLPEVISVSTTIAENTIMFLQDEFSEGTTGFDNLVKRAKKWNAAVDLVRFSPRAAVGDPEVEGLDVASDPEQTRGAGIVPRNELDSGGRERVEADAGLDRCVDILRKEGCLGGTSTFCGNENALLGR
ncbi:MAG: cytidylate kinase-like family protein, partial [bacterium]